MTQDKRWMMRYMEVMEFMETNSRNPSMHFIEDYDMLNWLKTTRKKMNAGELKGDRLVKFKELQVLMEEYKRVNQWK